MRRCVKPALLALMLLPVRAPANEDSQTMLRQGLVPFNRRDYGSALGFFISALEIDPKDEKALYYQARAAEALSEKRRVQIRAESLEIARSSLDQAERVRLSGILCERGDRARKAGDLLAAAALFQESRRVFPRHTCGVTGLAITRQALERRMNRSEASSQEIHALADFAMSGDGFLSATARPASRALAEPRAEPSFGALLTAPAVKPAPRVPAAPKAPRKLLPSPRDISASEELYLLAVVDYMSADQAKALESLRKALVLDPDNARAKTLLKRLELEQR